MTTSPEVDKAFTLLAEKLGTTVEYLWGVLLKQAPIQVFSDTILSVLVCVSFLSAGLIVYNKIKIMDGVEKPIGGSLITIGVMGFTVFLYNIPKLITVLYNPEYWALQQILNLK